MNDSEVGNGLKETTLEGQSIKELVAQYPAGDELDIQTGSDGEIVLTLVPAFQQKGEPPRYGNLAPLLAPLAVLKERISGALRTVELSPEENRIQRFSYIRALIPASASLVVETGYGGNPFSVRLQAV